MQIILCKLCKYRIFVKLRKGLKGIKIYTDMVVTTETKNTKPTYVLAKTRKKARMFADHRDIDLLEAYDILVTEGLKALGYNDILARCTGEEEKLRG